MFLFLAQVSRVIGSVFTILSDKSTNKRKIYLYNGIANLFNGVQYYLLNAISGAISSFAAIIRNVIFYKFPKKVPVIVVILYLIGIVLINSASYVNLFAIIPVLLVIIYTTALYINKVKLLKYAIILTCILEIVYDVYYKAYVGILVCVIDTILVIISLIKERELINKEDNVS